MASGKSLEKPDPHTVALYHNNGQPVRRAHPKEHMSKKERLRQRREEKEINAALGTKLYGDAVQEKGAQNGEDNKSVGSSG
jgi:hypothetical protein